MALASSRFETTLWSKVLLVGKEPDSAAGQQALARLCETYWAPVFAFVRRRGATVEDAQDLTQGFFEHILTTQFFSRADPSVGRFRSFLLGALRNHLAHTAEKQNSQRSGGRREKIPIDATLAENWLRAESSVHTDPTLAFDRTWANALIIHALRELEQEQSSGERHALFGSLKEFLQRKAKPGEYDIIARNHGMTKGAVAAATHRLNRRFGEIVRQYVRETVATPDLAEEELTHLFATMGE